MSQSINATEEEKTSLLHDGAETGSPPKNHDDASSVLERPLTILEELKDIIALAIPLFFSQLSWVAMKTTDTALLGHSGTKFLEASALSDLWTSSTGVFIQGRVLGMFVGNSLATNPKTGGEWLQVSLAVLSVIAIPVIALWMLTFVVMQHVFKETTLAWDAWYYSAVLSACIPARILFSQITQFFSAQREMSPAVVCSVFGMIVNLIAGLILVLGIPVPYFSSTIPNFSGYGFTGCPIVTTMAEYAQLGVLVGYFWKYKQLHRPCWPAAGWSMAHITKPRVYEYLGFYVPAALSIASDFWRVSVIGAIAATYGSVMLATFNTSYRILWMCLVISGSIGGSSAIKMARTFGLGRPNQAQQSAMVGGFLVAGVLSGLGAVVAIFPRSLGSVFTSDDQILDIFVEIRFALAAMMVTMNVSVYLERILMTMGRPKLVMTLNIIGSWGGQVPAVILFSKLYKGGKPIVGVFWGVSIGYGLLDLGFMYFILSSNWAQLSREAVARANK
eukprot:m.170802 g.170802  ORF g.170802 m.170802 type:complete len:503 (+) comp13292_c0_seq1:248-1756(+)